MKHCGFCSAPANLVVSSTVQTNRLRADHLVSVSPTVAEMNAAHFGDRMPPERSTFARNTVNAARVRELYRASVPLGTDGRAILPEAPGARTFVTVGRLSQAKNHLRLVAAFARVHNAAGEPPTRHRGRPDAR